MIFRHSLIVSVCVHRSAPQWSQPLAGLSTTPCPWNRRCNFARCSSMPALLTRFASGVRGFRYFCLSASSVCCCLVAHRSASAFKYSVCASPVT